MGYLEFRLNHPTEITREGGCEGGWRCKRTVHAASVLSGFLHKSFSTNIWESNKHFHLKLKQSILSGQDMTLCRAGRSSFFLQSLFYTKGAAPPDKSTFSSYLCTWLCLFELCSTGRYLTLWLSLTALMTQREDLMILSLKKVIYVSYFHHMTLSSALCSDSRLSLLFALMLLQLLAHTCAQMWSSYNLSFSTVDTG